MNIRMNIMKLENLENFKLNFGDFINANFNSLALQLLMNSPVRINSVHDFECRHVEEQIDDDGEGDWCEEHGHSQPPDRLLVLE